jgi:hypothetical protein
MSRSIRIVLLVRVAMITSACGGAGGTPMLESDESEVTVDNEAALESATSCPALELSVYDRSTGNSSVVMIPSDQVVATLTDTHLQCRPAEDEVYVFSRSSEWIVADADGNARWIPVVDVRYSGSTARIQYVDPDYGLGQTAWVGCEVPPTVTATALGYSSISAIADTAFISGTIVQDERGGTVWQLTCDFYAPTARLYANRKLPPVLVPNDDDQYFPDVDIPDLSCPPEGQCVENVECGTGHECWGGCCHVIIR